MRCVGHRHTNGRDKHECACPPVGVIPLRWKPAHERPEQTLGACPPVWGIPIAVRRSVSRRTPAHEWPEQALCACSPVGRSSRFALVVCSSIYALLGRGRAATQVRAKSVEFVCICPPRRGRKREIGTLPLHSNAAVLPRMRMTLPPRATAHPPHPIRVW